MSFEIKPLEEKAGKMSDEVFASIDSVKVPSRVYRRLSIGEVGATKNRMRIPCSVCGHVEPIDFTGVRSERLEVIGTQIERRAANMATQFFTNCWGLRTSRRDADRTNAIRSRFVDRIFLTGAGRFLRHLYRRAKRLGVTNWFAIGMHGDDSFGEQYFVCPLKNLGEVLRGIASDAPEFKRMLELATRHSASETVQPVQLKSPIEGRDDAEPIFDVGSAVPID